LIECWLLLNSTQLFQGNKPKRAYAALRDLKCPVV
jgi:hypothetical protein